MERRSATRRGKGGLSVRPEPLSHPSCSAAFWAPRVGIGRGRGSALTAARMPFRQPPSSQFGWPKEGWALLWLPRWVKRQQRRGRRARTASKRDHQRRRSQTNKRWLRGRACGSRSRVSPDTHVWDSCHIELGRALRRDVSLGLDALRLKTLQRLLVLTYDADHPSALAVQKLRIAIGFLWSHRGQGRHRDLRGLRPLPDWRLMELQDPLRQYLGTQRLV